MPAGVGSWCRGGPQPPIDTCVEESEQLGHRRELPDCPCQRRWGGGYLGLGMWGFFCLSSWVSPVHLTPHHQPVQEGALGWSLGQ